MGNRPTDRRLWLHTVLVLALLAVPTVAALGGHRFTDVPGNHVFHDDISWLADMGITRGCNPPTNSEFCPDDPVTRGQMAAFLKRFSDTVSGSGSGPSTRVSQSGGGNILISDDLWTTLATTTITPPSSGGAVYVDGGASLFLETASDLGAGGLIVATVNQSCSSTSAGPAAVWSTDTTVVDSAAVSGVFAASSGTQTIRLCGWALHFDVFERTEAFATISAIWFPSSQVALQDAAPQWPSVTDSMAVVESLIQERR